MEEICLLMNVGRRCLEYCLRITCNLSFLGVNARPQTFSEVYPRRKRKGEKIAENEGREMKSSLKEDEKEAEVTKSSSVEISPSSQSLLSGKTVSVCQSNEVRKNETSLNTEIEERKEEEEEKKRREKDRNSFININFYELSS
jgi:hypothetical protein